MNEKNKKHLKYKGERSPKNILFSMFILTRNNISLKKKKNNLMDKNKNMGIETMVFFCFAVMYLEYYDVNEK